MKLPGGKKIETSSEDMVDRVGQFGVHGSRVSDAADPLDGWVDLPSFRPSFGALLVRAGIASETDLREALAEGSDRGERLGEVVIRRGWASEEQVARLLSEQWQLPFAEADKVAVDAEALQRVSLLTARELRALPIGFDGTAVVLAVADPNEELFAEAKARIGDVSFVVVARSVLDPLIESASWSPAQDAPTGESASTSEESTETGEIEEYDPYVDRPAAAESVTAPAYEPDALPEYDPLESVERVAATEPHEQTLGKVVPYDPKRIAIRGSDVAEVATVIESIDIAAAGLGRVRTEVDQLGQSLGTANDQLAAQEAALAAAAERHDQDLATISRLEAELAQRADLFAKLTTQISEITETVKEGVVEDGDPNPYSVSRD